MADDQDQSQKTEEATPKRQEEARKKGQVANSKEPSTAFAFLILASLGITGAGEFVIGRIMSLMRDSFSGNLILETTPSGMQDLILRVFIDIAAFVLPIVIPIMLIGILATVMVTGPVFSFETLKPKLEKISPMKGIKRLFSTRALSEFVKSLLKLTVISLACWVCMVDLLPLTISAVRKDTASIASLAVEGSLTLIGLVAFIFFFIALMDVIYQRWEHAKSQRMAQKEIRDEHKESEGDPHLKAKIRQIQMEQSRNRMMSDVPKADVIITNPTHIAIALSYPLGSTGAPKVLAKGKGKVAEKIREIARENEIPIRENKPLARSLFKSVRIGDEIPEHLYEAVAVIIAEIYRIKAEENARAQG
ncbi:flagellar biosynthetic protein FlhB [Mariprofundus ferrinatatus]|uniref:Flagellar biosynthetic protein FlhB n=1 Tax=Mariprofundus ferrinatatus TaxID=1921087 RepID=A0A2K8L6S2_9PROT|nr:flagellar biosynthesis protein FlhB [Mariprofundus ferrinatatus]ATX82933.1 flagellar biosynthetic protein FlhB [Mariprofundus ferrinatatus]